MADDTPTSPAAAATAAIADSVASAIAAQSSIEPTTSSSASPSIAPADAENAERTALRARCVAAFSSGASYREVAEQLRLTVATAQSLVRQARRLGEVDKDEAPARPKGRPRLINDAVDAMLARIIQEKGTRSARVIQEELAKPPHNTTLSYEVVRRRVKQLIDSLAALPHRQHGRGGQADVGGDGKEQDSESSSLREADEVARDLDLLAETVRSIVSSATQIMDGDEGSDEQAGEDGQEAGDGPDNSLDTSRGVDEDELQDSNGPANIQTSPSEGQDVSSAPAASTCPEDVKVTDERKTASGEPRRRAGRPRAMTASMDETIVGELETDPAVTTRAVHATLLAKHPDLEASFETIRRRVLEIRAQRGLDSSAAAGEQSILAVEADGLATTSASESAGTAKTSPGSPPAPPSTRRVKKGEYSPRTRALCVEKHEVGGMSYAGIAKELGIPQDSVRAIIRKAKRTGSVQSAPRSGRPRKTSEIVDRVILQAVRANERSSAKAIQENLLKVFNVKVSSETIRRRVLANTRQRLLAISSGDGDAASSAGLPPLDDEAAAVAAAMAGQMSELQAATATSQQPPPTDASSVLVESSSGALAATSGGVGSKPVVIPSAVSPPRAATGEKRHLDASETSSPPSQPSTGDAAALSAAPVPNDPTQESQTPQQPKKKRAKRREYSVELREKCVAMHQQGEGYRRIGQALDMPHTTVRAIVDKVTRTGSVLPAPRSGRPRKTDEIVDRVILEAVRANEKCSARMIQEELQRGFGVRISCETIRRRVKDHSRQSLARGEALLSGSAPPTPGLLVQGSSQQAVVALPGFATQSQQQLAPAHEDPMLQLLTGQAVADDGTSVVI